MNFSSIRKFLANAIIDFTLPGNFSILLFLAVNDRGYGVSLDADSKSVPFAVGQASTEFDDLPLTSMDALIVKFELAADLEGHDFFPVHVVNGEEHLLEFIKSLIDFTYLHTVTLSHIHSGYNRLQKIASKQRK